MGAGTAAAGQGALLSSSPAWMHPFLLRPALEEDVPSASMSFLLRSRSGSNQPEALSIAPYEDRPAQVKRKRTPIKKKLGLPKKKGIDIPKVPLDSPSMGTRSKAAVPSSHAMRTSSKRRLSL